MYGSNRLIQRYEEQSISTMSGGELIIRLYDEIIKNLKFATKMYSQKNNAAAQKCTEKCRKIINYLTVILDGKYQLSSTLRQLYTYMVGQIIITEATGDTSHIDVLIPQLEDLRSAWVEAEKGLHTKDPAKLKLQRPDFK